ncbi:hypothetical protein [Streptomyces luteireticuli]|uniref:hypothetical protein n=1 Tax=Streptomyces luteireticuli TaxID=173858 RepID=UPI0031E0F8A6
MIDRGSHVRIESELPEALTAEVLRELMEALLSTDSWSFVRGSKSGHAVGVTVTKVTGNLTHQP